LPIFEAKIGFFDFLVKTNTENAAMTWICKGNNWFLDFLAQTNTENTKNGRCCHSIVLTKNWLSRCTLPYFRSIVFIFLTNKLAIVWSKHCWNNWLNLIEFKHNCPILVWLTQIQKILKTLALLQLNCFDKKLTRSIQNMETRLAMFKHFDKKC
jgi:hypothetical protein